MAAICSGGQAVKDLVVNRLCAHKTQRGLDQGGTRRPSRAPGPGTSHPGMPPAQGRGPCLLQIERMMSDRNRAH